MLELRADGTRRVCVAVYSGTDFFLFLLKKKNKKKEAAEYNREKFLNVKPSGAEALCSSAVLLQGEKVGCFTRPKGKELIWNWLKLSLNGGVVKTLCVCVCVCANVT